MVGALWTGISGLAGSQTGLDNESNNIANVNTIGYKASRVSFADQMYQDKIGKGVTSFDVEKMYTQGSLKNTGVSYDMALSSDGFFQLSNGSDTFYTRAGNFRMGESGNLENVGQNTVQGWAMSPLTEDDVISTDPNATYFTNEFTKTLGTKIIRDSTTVETIIAKSTDYNVTVESDAEVIYTGSGQKSASAKKSDIDLLTVEYQQLLTTHAKANPKPTASASSTQKDYLNFNLDSVAIEAGDQLYVSIDGKTHAVNFDTDEATTIKKLADLLSNKGFKSHYTDGIENNPAGTVKEGAYAFDNAQANPKGGIYLEGIVPGKSHRITEFGWTDSSNDNQATKGEVKSIQAAVKGTGIGGIESVEMALAQAVSGKQQDVYTAEELILSSTNTDNDFSYQINIYDKDSKTNKIVPATALDMSDMTDIDSMVKAINTVANTDGSAVNTELAYYVKAFNINGNLVVKTLDHNNDVEFTGELKGPIPEQQTIKLSGKVDLVEHQSMSIGGTVTSGAAATTLLATTIPAGTFTTGDAAEKVIDWVITNKATVISDWNLANATLEIEDIVKTAAGTIEIIYKDGEGNVAIIADAAASNGIDAAASAEEQAGAGTFSFLGHTIASITHGNTTSATVEKIVAAKDAIMTTWNAVGANANRQIADIVRLSSDEIKVVYKNTMGDVPNITAAEGYSNAAYGMKFTASEEITKGSLKGLITRNLNYSGREGAGAEFLKITTTINQTASKDSIQLKLDSLGLTDSAFGDFSIDKTGLVIMQQDGVNYAVGQVAVAKFTDNRGLDPVGGNLLKATTRSGNALFNINNDKTSEIVGSNLELSTADLSESLVNLMVFQRAFEANAKSITTADSILTTLIQLKR